jgi:hypothetical protein
VNLGVLNAALRATCRGGTDFREAQRDDPNNPVSYTYFARWLKSIRRTEGAALHPGLR